MKREMKEIRDPCVAGSFYPEKGVDLRKAMDDLFSGIEETPFPQELKSTPIMGLIVPHAGIQYSGKTAVHGFIHLRGREFGTFILIGPSHHASFPGVRVDLRKGWRTPLGVASIDQELGEELAREYESTGFLRFDPFLFNREHSLEVEIPFLQRIFPTFQFLPFLLGDLLRESCEFLARILGKLSKRHSLFFIASSDLYHGYDEEECQRSDENLLSLIRSMESEPLANSLLKYPPPACGASAIFTLMLVGKGLGAKRVELLHRSNSSEIQRDPSGYVVGYASLALTQ